MQKGTYDEATRTVVTWMDDDHRSQQMFVPGPGGEEMEMLTIEYERAK